ncbi:kinase-like domain-containing protein [Lasiosphaeria ovina]|uniref:Kinase-like domain-containing protein n=1 Tax=Lasiosphaeria ovina TaxID=92902 RepID=A0AAE0JX22_9PEZI|nr:kinase-like domain-containing protein [Lasiosphaeria ovina]
MAFEHNTFEEITYQIPKQAMTPVSESWNGVESIIATISDLGFSDQLKLDENGDGATKAGAAVNALDVLKPPRQYNQGVINQGTTSSSPQLEVDNDTNPEIKIRRAYDKSKINETDFLPIDKLQEFTTTSAIRQILQRTFPDDPDHEINELTRAVFGHEQGGEALDGQQRRLFSRKRIFVLLALCQHIPSIKSFIENGVCDSHLPLLSSSGSSVTVEDRVKMPFYIKQDSDTPCEVACFDGWPIKDKEWWEKYQYVVLVPFFCHGPDRLNFYPFQADTILPFTEFSKEMIEGGQASVGKITIHPAHHNFKRNENSIDPCFAVKRLHSHNPDDFKKEVEILARFRGKNEGHPHLIRLLLTYSHGEAYHMVFPWADGNLSSFWETRVPDRTPEGAHWLLKQCHGISQGLEKIHGRMPTAERSESTDDRDKEDAGRHGDIKPENILWFEHDTNGKDHLVISDFGLSRFHRMLSRSLGYSPGYSSTYQAPECKLGQPISPRYDIWSLGCVLLEFLTWFLDECDHGSDHSINKFSDRRLHDEGPELQPSNIRGDKFYLLFYPTQDSRHRVKLKPSVIRWIIELHQLDHCPWFAHEMLDLIQNGLLLTDARSRWECHRVVEKLDEIRKECEADPLRYVEGRGWKSKTTEAPEPDEPAESVEAVEADEPAKPAEPAEPAEADEAVEADEPAEPAEPVEAAEAVEADRRGGTVISDIRGPPGFDRRAPGCGGGALARSYEVD